jgi:hypothetical protein
MQQVGNTHKETGPIGDIANHLESLLESHFTLEIASYLLLLPFTFPTDAKGVPSSTATFAYWLQYLIWQYFLAGKCVSFLHSFAIDFSCLF